MPELKKKEEPKISNKKIILTISILAIVITIILLFIKLTDRSNLSLEVYVPIPEASMDVGVVGSIGEGETIETINPGAFENPVRDLDIATPRDIFNTSGTIIAIQANSVIIKGIGTNFDDQMKRDLVVVIDENTTVNGVRGNAEYFKQILKVGDEITIESDYNIHGKTEFLAKYVNSIKE